MVWYFIYSSLAIIAIAFCLALIASLDEGDY